MFKFFNLPKNTVATNAFFVGTAMVGLSLAHQKSKLEEENPSMHATLKLTYCGGVLLPEWELEEKQPQQSPGCKP